MLRIFLVTTLLAFVLVASLIGSSATATASSIESVSLPTDVAQTVSTTYAFGRRGHDYGGVSNIEWFAVSDVDSVEQTLDLLVRHAVNSNKLFSVYCGALANYCATRIVAGGPKNKVIPFLSDLIADFEGAPGADTFLSGLSMLRDFIATEQGVGKMEYFVQFDAVHKVSFIVDSANTTAMIVWYDLGTL
jgi:hypothetical protein